MTLSWLRFTWDLSKVPTGDLSAPSPFVLRVAEDGEEDVIGKVTESAFRMDSGWGNFQSALLEHLARQCGAAFAKADAHRVIVLLHGARIIGSSVVCLDEDAPAHLATGPCVLHEYRSRGLGTALLGASLGALAKSGLRTARGVARDRTIAARYIYPKFGGMAEPWDPGFEAPPKVAA
jgi:GNAT superfamily N-acetyltransferase